MTTMENSLDPDQVQPFLLGLIWVQTVCKDYQAMTIQVGVRMPNFYYCIHISYCRLENRNQLEEICLFF